MRRNATFRTSIQVGTSHPKGEEVANFIQRRLNGPTQADDAVENWRDCGWCISSTIGGLPVLIALADPEDERFDYRLQISSQASFFRRLFGSKSTKAGEKNISQRVAAVMLSHEEF